MSFPLSGEKLTPTLWVTKQNIKTQFLMILWHLLAVSKCHSWCFVQVLVENGTKEGHQILMEARNAILKVTHIYVFWMSGVTSAFFGNRSMMRFIFYSFFVPKAASLPVKKLTEVYSLSFWLTAGRRRGYTWLEEPSCFCPCVSLNPSLLSLKHCDVLFLVIFTLFHSLLSLFCTVHSWAALPQVDQTSCCTL